MGKTPYPPCERAAGLIQPKSITTSRIAATAHCNSVTVVNHRSLPQRRKLGERCVERPSIPNFLRNLGGLSECSDNHE